MVGNVWEWVNDWWQEDYYSVSPSNNPLGPATGTDKVLRGGSWAYGWFGMRTANRGYYDLTNQDSVNYAVDFRCASDPEE